MESDDHQGRSCLLVPVDLAAGTRLRGNIHIDYQSQPGMEMVRIQFILD